MKRSRVKLKLEQQNTHKAWIYVTTWLVLLKTLEQITSQSIQMEFHYVFIAYYYQCFNPTLYGGGHSVPSPPPNVLVSGLAFQSNLRDPKCWHNSYMKLRIIYICRKKNQNFFNNFFNFFQFSVAKATLEIALSVHQSVCNTLINNQL